MVKSVFIILFLITFISCNNTSTNENLKTNKPVVTDTLQSIPKKTDLHKVSKQCIETVFKIIESSNEYKKLTKNLEQIIQKNGGTGYGFMVQVSPNPILDNALEKGDFYEISVHESYPDRINNIAFFRFDRHQKMLFKMDIASAEYIEVHFDENLINEFNKACYE